MYMAVKPSASRADLSGRAHRGESMNYSPRTLIETADPVGAGHGDRELAPMGPFGLLMLVGLVLVPLTSPRLETGTFVAALAAMAVIAAVAVLVHSRRLNGGVRFGAAIGSLAVVALLRQAEPVGSSAVGVLTLVPVLWASLYGSRRQLLVSVAGVAATFAVPIVAVGAPHYTASEWSRTMLWSLAALIIGSAIQRLVLTVRRQANALERLALTDSLTGVPNHRAWAESLDRELARARRTGGPLALAMIDLDHLKRVNDRGGHQAGSNAIKSAAAAWRSSIRASDILARFGGDEFGVILPGTTDAPALSVAERLRRATPGSLTCSIGVTCWDGQETADELFARADRALYDAKEGGRDRVVARRAEAPHAGV